MKKDRYVNITIDGEEDNIGIIFIGEYDYNDTIDIIKAEKPLVEALGSHFDCDIKIKKSGDLKRTHPIVIEFDVVVCADGADYDEKVTLTETWVYGKN